MKKLVSLILAAAMMLGMATMAAAAPTGKITEITAPIDTNASYDFSSVQIGTRNVYEFPLTANMFSWSDGAAGAKTDPVSTSQLNSANIKVRTTTLDSSAIQSVTIDTKAFSVTNNQKTAYVKVTFVDNFVSVTGKNFKTSVYLAFGSNRVEESKLVLEGTVENETVTAGSGTDYVDLSKGRVLVPSAYINNLEIGLGGGVMIKTRVYSDRKYYATAKEYVSSDDGKVLDKYPDIDTVVVLSTVNITGTGNIVYLEGYDSYHVYNASGKYLGSSDNAVSLSTKYYLSKKKIDMGGGIESSSSSTQSSSSSQGNSQSGTTITATGAAITTEVAKSKTAAAASTAKASGAKTAVVRINDAGSISSAALKAMPGSAQGLAVSLVVDTMNGKSVAGRITVNPALATLTSDTQLGVYVDSAHTSATKTRFEKFFKNQISVVSLAQQGSYGMSVKIAAKVSLSGFNTSSLYFYSYDKASNKYNQIQKPSYSVDANGYVHFYTSAGGDILISNGPLAKK